MTNQSDLILKNDVTWLKNKRVGQDAFVRYIFCALIPRTYTISLLDGAARNKYYYFLIYMDTKDHAILSCLDPFFLPPYTREEITLGIRMIQTLDLLLQKRPL